jgi:SAM-dependent methyltransferase
MKIHVKSIIKNILGRVRSKNPPLDSDQYSAIDEVKKNTPQAFNYFWASEYAQNCYMEKAREDVMIYISTVIHRFASRDILDVGCGPGHIIEYVLRIGNKKIPGPIIGIDYSKVAVTQAQKRVREATFIVGDALSLPFHDCSFSCVLCIETLEHVQDPNLIVNELKRVNSTDGIIIVCVPNGELDTWDGHQHFFKPEDLHKLFFGLQIIHQEYVNENRAILIVLKR